MNITQADQTVTSAGPTEWFTGAVWIETIAPEQEPSRLRASRVFFSAGARTAWHTHPAGQTLHVLEGVARVQSDGGPVREISPGATATFAAGERHWHGAGPDRPMVHLALQDAAGDGALADWSAHVTDEEYAGDGDRAPITRQDLLNAVFHESPVIDRSRVSRIALAPGQAAARHLHPCHVIGCVLSGTIRFQVADQPATLLAAGDAFHEPQGVHIPHFDNASDSQPAVFLACYLLPPGEERPIEMLEST